MTPRRAPPPPLIGHPAGGWPTYRIGKACRTLFLAFPVALGLLPWAGPAAAGCTDQPAEGVSWRRCYLDGRDLTGVTLSGAELRDASFTRTVLEKARLDKVDGYRAKFVSARLAAAVLDGARLIEADFTRADLSGASLRGADLRNAKFVGADLRGADFSGARLDGADFRNAQLEGAVWTDGARVCAQGSVGQCHS